MAEKEVLLHVEHLVKHFPIKKGIIFQRAAGAVHAVDDVTFDIYSGETLGLVGESGCGKSTTGRTILQLYRPTSGKVIFEGEDLAALKGETLRRKRRDIQMIFQDPYASLNPRMTVGRIIAEPMEIHGTYRGAARDRRVAELLSLVGLNPAFVNRYPHEFSGGQRQRVGIARALTTKPEVLLCDEPTGALDYRTSKEILALMEQVNQRYGCTMIIVTHNDAIRHMSNHILRLRDGELVEDEKNEHLMPASELEW